MILIDLNVVENSKQSESHSVNNSKNLIDLITEPIKELVELTLVPNDCIEIHKCCQAQSKVFFNQQFLALYQEIRRQAALVEFDSNGP